ncbi:alkane 1-monooxygenase [Rhodobacteraceae bacterium F11138]|nr:alkane 1-monooxygenase [Rhodobacteraceae bacterium F11138]
MIRFAFASLSPVATLTAACLAGGIWPWLALIHVTVVVTVLDRLTLRLQSADAAPDAPQWALRLNILLAVLHLLLIYLGVWALAQNGILSIWQKLAAALALGLYLGQVANSNAHELIHAPGRWARRLGTAVFTALLFGHHASAHMRVHHVHVASDGDPNSARLGETFYRFWPRAWIGSFRAGLRADTLARARSARRLWSVSHPYVGYCAGALLSLALAYGVAGPGGCLILLALAGYAQMQLLLADYVQHYGLRRGRMTDGRLHPPGPHHSWNAPHWYSSAMMLNAPRHSDHHQHPARRFPCLGLDETTMPVWPYSMPVMATLALFPSRWRRKMDPLATRWQSRIGQSASHPASGRDTRPQDLSSSQR